MDADNINIIMLYAFAIFSIFVSFICICLCMATGRESRMVEGHRNINNECAEYAKDWATRTDNEIWELKKKQCSKCFYFSVSKGTHVTAGTCDYILLEGHTRGCSPFECKEKGIFRPRNVKKKKKALQAVFKGKIQ